MRIFWRVLIFAALWLLLETSISWIATCDPANQPYQTKGAQEEHCTLFRGPLISASLFIFRWIGNIENNTITAIATVAIAVFTLTLWLTNRRMWEASVQQTRVSARSARAASDAASAAERQAWLSERTAERQLRAYVGLESAIALFVNNGFGLDVSAVFRNSGQTPAYKLTVWATVLITDINIPPFTDPPPIPEENAGSIILTPNAHVSSSRVIPLSSADREAVVEGRKAIYFWGAVRYLDAFGRQRVFVFRCWASGRDAVIKDYGRHGWGFDPHPRGYEGN